MGRSVVDEVNKLLKMQNEGRISGSEFARAIQDLIKCSSPYFKEDILELLKELWYQSYYIIPNLEDEFRLEVALKLLNMIDNVHMNTAEKQFELYKQAEKIYDIHIFFAHFYIALPILSQLPSNIWGKEYESGINWNEKVGLSLMKELSEYYGNMNIFLIPANSMILISTIG
jgi:hypothetical protein